MPPAGLTGQKRSQDGLRYRLRLGTAVRPPAKGSVVTAWAPAWRGPPDHGARRTTEPGRERAVAGPAHPTVPHRPGPQEAADPPRFLGPRRPAGPLPAGLAGVSRRYTAEGARSGTAAESGTTAPSPHSEKRTPTDGAETLTCRQPTPDEAQRRLRGCNVNPNPTPSHLSTGTRLSGFRLQRGPASQQEHSRSATETG